MGQWVQSGSVLCESTMVIIGDKFLGVGGGCRYFYWDLSLFSIHDVFKNTDDKIIFQAGPLLWIGMLQMPLLFCDHYWERVLACLFGHQNKYKVMVF